MIPRKEGPSKGYFAAFLLGEVVRGRALGDTDRDALDRFFGHLVGDVKDSAVGEAALGHDTTHEGRREDVLECDANPLFGQLNDDHTTDSPRIRDFHVLPFFTLKKVGRIERMFALIFATLFTFPLAWLVSHDPLPRPKWTGSG